VWISWIELVVVAVALVLGKAAELLNLSAVNDVASTFEALAAGMLLARFLMDRSERRLRRDRALKRRRPRPAAAAQHIDGSREG
jgi:hypothetical protein